MDPGSDFDNIRSSAAPTGVSLGTDAGDGGRGAAYCATIRALDTSRICAGARPDGGMKLTDMSPRNER